MGGHWPSGWQHATLWPVKDYIGVDINPELVVANDDFVLVNGGPLAFGPKSMRFIVGNMLTEALPSGDLLLTKDTLDAFPNAAIWTFLNLSVIVCPPRFKYVM